MANEKGMRSVFSILPAQCEMLLIYYVKLHGSVKFLPGQNGQIYYSIKHIC